MSVQPSSSQPQAAQSETQKFLEWHQAEQAKGLVDIKFLTRDVSNATVESFCAGVNALNNAQDVEDPELF